MTTSGGHEPTLNDREKVDRSSAEITKDPVVLDDLLDNGQGVGRVGGVVAFVTGGLPRERVTIAVDAVKRNFVSAHALSILERSPDRIESVCPVFPECGGCQVLHLRYEAQLAWKQRLIRDALERLGGITADVEPVVAAPNANSGYRNKVALVSKFARGAMRLGFYAARSHRVVPVEHCPVAMPRLDALIRELVKLAAERPAAFNEARHVVARASATGKQLVVSVNSERPNKALSAVTDEIRERIPQLTGLVSNWDPASENAVFGRRFATLFGRPVVAERVAGADLTIGLGSFFQVNTPVLEMIAQRLVTLLDGSRRVVDLYSGVGTFGVILGKRSIPSTGVESFRPAVADAAANAAANGVTCAAFECATAVEATAGDRGRTLFAGADAAIVDPPRRGCEAEVIAAIVKHGPARVAYLSCKPATLARDGKLLVDGGYRLARVTPFDMFPQTGHVEALAEFER